MKRNRDIALFGAAALAVAALCHAQNVPLDEAAGQAVLQPLDEVPAAEQYAAPAAPAAPADAQQAEAAEPENNANVADPSLRALRISTRVFKLAHANAEEVAERFNATWSGEFGTTWRISRIATSFPEVNAVMVTAPKRILDV